MRHAGPAVHGRVGLLLCLLVLAPLPARAVGPAPAQQDARQAEGGRGAHNQAQLWREVRSGAPGVSQVRGAESGVLIQPAGETWRELRAGPLTFYGGLLLSMVPLAILLFHGLRGTVRLDGPPSGRTIVRFNNWERLVHWLAAISFVMLALSGLTLFLGRHLLLPLVGYTTFSWLAGFAKNFHNFLGFLFAGTLVLLLLTFARDNLWDRYDWGWIRRAGGLLSGAHVPSRRFNFGEKVWFWVGAGALCLTVAVSGGVLLFPNVFELRTTMQVANAVHLVAALLAIAFSLGHIYMGTLGVEGAYGAMISGEVDEAWARQHHEAWLEEVNGGKGAQR